MTANELGTLLRDQIPIVENGYLHAYVSNGSNKAVDFDNFKVTYLRGQTRQINHYYPYGLSISGLGGNYDEYLNKYTSKELQTGEFDPHLSSGLEMFDFHTRFYDPQLGRWFTPLRVICKNMRLGLRCICNAAELTCAFPTAVNITIPNNIVFETS